MKTTAVDLLVPRLKYLMKITKMILGAWPYSQEHRGKTARFPGLTVVVGCCLLNDLWKFWDCVLVLTDRLAQLLRHSYWWRRFGVRILDRSNWTQRRNRCDIFSELFCPGAKPRKWALLLVTRFVVIPASIMNIWFFFIWCIIRK